VKINIGYGIVLTEKDISRDFLIQGYRYLYRLTLSLNKYQCCGTVTIYYGSGSDF
jgi:hypothetical protein